MPHGSLALQSRMRMWNTEGGGAGGAGSESQGSESESGNTGETKTYTQEDIDKLSGSLEAERKRARDLDRDFKKVQSDLKKLQDADKPELERITGERDELNTKYEKALSDLRDARAQTIVAKAARDAKAISPNAVYAMIARGLEFDDNNEPTNVAQLIAGVQKSDPDLFKEIVSGSGDGGAGNNTGAVADDMNSIIRGMAGKSS